MSVYYDNIVRDKPGGHEQIIINPVQGQLMQF